MSENELYAFGRAATELSSFLPSFATFGTSLSSGGFSRKKRSGRQSRFSCGDPALLASSSARDGRQKRRPKSRASEISDLKWRKIVLDEPFNVWRPPVGQSALWAASNSRWPVRRR